MESLLELRGLVVYFRTPAVLDEFARREPEHSSIHRCHSRSIGAGIAVQGRPSLSHFSAIRSSHSSHKDWTYVTGQRDASASGRINCIV